MDWEKIFASDATNKGPISKILTQFIQVNTKKQRTQTKNEMS